MLLGAVADDLTGATDLALMIARQGMKTVQVIGRLPEAGGFGDAEILVGTNQDEGNQINSIYSVRSQVERVDFSRPENRRRWEGNRLRPVRLVYLMFIFSFFFFLFPPHTQGRTLSSTTLFSTLRRTIPAY